MKISPTLIDLSPKQEQWLDLVFSLTKKRIKTQYKHTKLGFLWVIINPLLQMITIGLIFQFFLPFKIDNYYLFLFSGLLPWSFFSAAISRTTNIIVDERQLIQKAKFPKEIIVLSSVLASFFDLIFSLLLLIVFFVGQVIIKITPTTDVALLITKIALVIPLLIWILTLTTGLALFFSAIQVKRRDTNFMVKSILPLWFYATPIIYQVKFLPDAMRFWLYLNPLTAIIENFHYILLENFSYQIKNLFELNLMSVALTLAITYFGWKIFKKESKYFDDWL
jgi:lipopolysaccharide transport system permease protein